MADRALLLRGLCVLFVLLASVFHFLAGAPPGTRAAYGIGLQFLLAALMLGAWAATRTGGASAERWTLLAGTLARLVVAPLSVANDTDVQRYLWDGAVFWAGLDPYRLAPGAPDLGTLRALWPTPHAHMGYSTIYPPGAVFLFGLATSFGPVWAPWLWKLLIVAASLETLWVGASALKGLGLSRHLALLAFSPLLVAETAARAHLDMLCALAVAGGLNLAARGRAAGAGVVLGAGALVKFLPALALLPFLMGHFRGWAAFWLVAGALAVVALGYVGAFLAGLHPLGSLPVFFERWRFGSPIFSALVWVLGDARALRVAPLIAVFVLLLAAKRSPFGWWKATPFALAAPLLASPVVFPWYLVSLVPAVAAAPSGFALAWLTVIPVTEEVEDRAEQTGLWEPATWPLWVVGASWLAGLAIDFTGRQRAREYRGPVHRKPRVTVVMPVLDEEARIGTQLAELRSLPGIHEIIVVDGGSTDRTLEIVASHRGVMLLAAPRGRGTQMNAGARVATGDVLLFLHADVHLPKNAIDHVAAALRDPQVVAGAFRTWTVAEGRKSWVGPLLRLADLRSRYTTLPYGDQAIFVRAEVFWQVGGFPNQPLMEDLELSRRLRAVGKICTVPAMVIVSGRRFLARPISSALLMKSFPLLYRLGVPPRLLASLYGNPR